MVPETRSCQSCKNPFTVEPDDFTFYEKMRVVPSTRCPECRYLRRLQNRNEWSLYRRRCDFTGADIVSIYREGMPFPVYKQEAWWSDQWDPLSYGQDFDFSRPFFDQFRELRDRVPHLALVNSNSTNSEYTNQSQNNKDCYMCSATGDSEKCMYGNWFQLGCYFSADCYNVEACELCYECLNSARSYGCVFSQDLHDCTQCYFSTDCRGCSNCFGCIGLRNKKYCWFNQQLSKDAYEAEVKKLVWNRGTITQMHAKTAELASRFPRKFYHGTNNVRFSGDYLEHTKNTHLSFNARHNEDTAYLQDAWKAKDCLDLTETLRDELSYELQGCADCHRSIALRSCWTLNDCSYCDLCFSSNNLFGCIGLRGKQYCILNKQYTKEGYEELKARIIAHMKKTGEWGEWFPEKISPFAYNESVAQDYFPLTRESALTKGYLWHERVERKYEISLTTDELPQTVQETGDGILRETIRCATQDNPEWRSAYPLCATAFRIVPLELEFYRKVGLPIPAKCFSCRRTDRFALRNPRKLWHRRCTCGGERSENGTYQNQSSHFHGGDHCPNEFETSYDPDRPEIVYCESCYQAEVV